MTEHCIFMHKFSDVKMSASEGQDMRLWDENRDWCKVAAEKYALKMADIEKVALWKARNNAASHLKEEWAP